MDHALYLKEPHVASEPFFGHSGYKCWASNVRREKDCTAHKLGGSCKNSWTL